MALATYNIVVTNFYLQDKCRKNEFFKKFFLLAGTNMEIVLDISFFLLSNRNVWFTIKKLE